MVLRLDSWKVGQLDGWNVLSSTHVVLSSAHVVHSSPVVLSSTRVILSSIPVTPRAWDSGGPGLDLLDLLAVRGPPPAMSMVET